MMTLGPALVRLSMPFTSIRNSARYMIESASLSALAGMVRPMATATTRLQTPSRRNRLEVVIPARSEEHTSELQSHHDLVCRLLLEKKKTQKNRQYKLKKKNKTKK